MQVSLSPETAAPLKTELAAISTAYLNLSMPSLGTNTASPGGLSHYWPAANFISYHLDRACLKLNSRAIQSNIAFCSNKPTDAIPSPPIAEEKDEHSGDGRELSEDSIWARSWKRRILPRVGLRIVEPVLYSNL